MRKFGFFGLSLCLHGLLVVGLFVLVSFNKTADDSQDFQVEILSAPSSSSSLKSRAERSSKRGSGFAKFLKPLRSIYETAQESTDNTAGTDSDSDGWKVSYNYLSQGFDSHDGMQAHDVRFIKSLWSEIDKAIIDNPYLSEYGHTGRVYFKFDLNTEGQLIENSIRAEAQDNVLKVLAARAIRKALKNETGELYLPKKNMRIHAQFAWTDPSTCEVLRGTHKNYLSFCKHTQNKRKNFSTSEKLGTYLSALQYGTGAIEEIEKYNKEEFRRKTNFDPFESLRRDPDWNLGS